MTACGNFGITASSTGAISMYNMQSGIPRRTFNIGPCPPNAPSRFRPLAGKNKEERCVTGLASDALDRIVVASTLDGTINVSCGLPFAPACALIVLPCSVLRLPYSSTRAYTCPPFCFSNNHTASRQWPACGRLRRPCRTISRH